MSTKNTKEKKALVLERQMTSMILNIKQGTMTPENSKIGVLFKQLKPLDEALYEKFMTEYKVVLAEFKKTNK